jgi:hypothetical protein
MSVVQSANAVLGDVRVDAEAQVTARLECVSLHIARQAQPNSLFP